MKLWLAYEAGFALAISLSLLAVLLGGELPAVAYATLATPWLAAILHHRGRALSGALGTVLAVAALALGASVILRRGVEAALLAGSIALIGTLVARLLTRVSLRHDIQALLISLLLVFAGAGLHTQFTYGVIFVTYAISASWALTTRQLVAGAEREAARPGGAPLPATLARRDIATPAFFLVTGLTALLVLSTTTLLFLAFPRVGFANLGFFGREQRFPDEVSLAGEARINLGSGEVLARVRGLERDDFDDGLYLRGAVYDVLSPVGFARSPRPAELPPSKQKPVTSGDPRAYDVFVQPVLGPLLPTLGPVVRAHITAGGQNNPTLRQAVRGQGPSGELLAIAPLTGPVRYQVLGWVSHFEPPTESAPAVPTDDPTFAHYLRWPSEMDTRIAAWARDTVGDASTPGQKARRIRERLRRDFAYSTEQPNAAATDPLAAFFFTDQRGHCEYFATAFASALRTVGVPSRVVGGFAGGLWDPEEKLVVFTRTHAHAWVEWYQPGAGWILDDATPTATASPQIIAGLLAMLEKARRVWDDYVLDYGLNEQVELFSEAMSALRRSSGGESRQIPWRQIGLGALAVAASLALGWLAFGLRRRRRVRLQPLARAILGACERLAVHADPTASLRQLVERASPRASPVERTILAAAVEIYEALRFGRAEDAPDATRVNEQRRALTSVARGVNLAPRRAA